MKTLTIKIEVPLPDEATAEDADALAKHVGRLAVTQRTKLNDPVQLDSRVHGKVVGWEMR